MNNILKLRNQRNLSLYVRSKGDAIRWKILGDPVSSQQVEPTLIRYDFVHDITTITSVGIEVIERTDTQSAVIMELIELGGEPLRDLDHFCVYKLKRGGIKRSYGYLDEPGVCVFKIRFDSVTHNFLLYSMPNLKYQTQGDNK